MLEDTLPEGLTFDDVLLLPAHSDVLPRDTDVSTLLTNDIELNIPLISAAMDTVTEANLAIALAQEGGIGIIHKNLDIEAQAAEVDKVKRSESGMIVDPITMGPHQRVQEAIEVMTRYRISGIPITEGPKLAGILTNRDLRFVSDLQQPVSALMTSENLVTVPQGTGLDEAQKLLHQHRIEKLLGGGRRLSPEGPHHYQGHRKTPGAIPWPARTPWAACELAPPLVSEKNAASGWRNWSAAAWTWVVVDSAHGHATSVLEAVEDAKKMHPGLQVIGGNVATPEAVNALINAGADAVKVGMGPSSICTTRVVAGIGVPQLTAIGECAKVGAQFQCSDHC